MISEGVTRFVIVILNCDVSPASINQTLLVLIPKVKKLFHASQF